MKLIKTLPVQNELGEGIQWHAPSQSLWWTDILNARLYQYLPESDHLAFFDMPERVGCFAFTNQANVMIIAFASGIALYNMKDKSCQWICRPELSNPGNRFNDGRVDRQGRFWAGTLVENSTLSTEKASLYMIDSTLTCHTMLSGLTISNSLCFDLDGTTIYHTDTPEQKICSYAIEGSTNRLECNHTLIETTGSSFPDGSCIDSENHLWNAQWGNGEVLRYTPKGDVDLSLTLPVPHTSCVAIGGPNMNWLFVTSARQGLTEQQLLDNEQSGDVFIYQLDGITGVEESIFQPKK